MRKFKKQWFAGNGEKSGIAANEIRLELEKALDIITGLQQPIRAGSEESQRKQEAQNIEYQIELDEIAEDIYCALTGKEVTQDEPV